MRRTSIGIVNRGSSVWAFGPIQRVMACSRRDILAAIPGVALLPIGRLQDRQTPPPVLPATWESAVAPRVAVAAATPVVLGESTVLVGGFTDRLEATAAVQLRDSGSDWLPIGTSLLEPRAEPVVVPIGGGELLVIGGWTGRLPDARVFLSNAEICDPRNPHRRRATPPPFTSGVSLEGARATALSDGRVLLILDRRGVLFDPESESWSAPFPLHARRRHGTLVALGPSPAAGGDRVVVVGGHSGDEPAVETVLIPRTGVPTSTIWDKADLPGLIGSSAAARPRSGTIVLAGGVIDGRSTSRTWILDTTEQQTRTGPDLRIPGGISRATMVVRGSRLLVLGGERFEDGRPMPAAHGAVIGPARGRTLALPPNPVTAVRAAVVATPTDVTVIGGYRFDPTATIGARTRVLRSADRLKLPSLVIAD